MNDALLKLCIKFQNLLSREEGQDLVEYGLIVALLSLAAVASLKTMSSTIASIFNTISTTLSAA